MAAVEFEGVSDKRPEPSGFSGLLRLLAPMRRWHERRQTLARLSQLGVRQLEDVGQDPAQIPGALNAQHASPWDRPHNRPDIR